MDEDREKGRRNRGIRGMWKREAGSCTLAGHNLGVVRFIMLYFLREADLAAKWFANVSKGVSNGLCNVLERPLSVYPYTRLAGC